MTIPDELHQKLREAIAKDVIDAKTLQGYMRWFLRHVLEAKGIRFRKDYESSMPAALMYNDSTIPEDLRKIILINGVSHEAEPEEALPIEKPAENLVE